MSNIQQTTDQIERDSTTIGSRPIDLEPIFGGYTGYTDYTGYTRYTGACGVSTNKLTTIQITFVVLLGVLLGVLFGALAVYIIRRHRNNRKSNYSTFV